MKISRLKPLLRALVVAKTRLKRNLLIFITAKRCHCCGVKACWFYLKIGAKRPDTAQHRRAVLREQSGYTALRCNTLMFGSKRDCPPALRVNECSVNITIFIIYCGCDGKLWFSHAGLSTNHNGRYPHKILDSSRLP